MPLVITTKSRPTPYLQEYLRALISRPTGQLWKAGVVGGLGVPASTFLGVGIAAGMGGNVLQTLGIAAGCAIAAIGGTAAYAYRLWKREQEAPDAALMKEARTVAIQIQNQVNNRRLYRAMHPAAVDLLEESARCWKRTVDAVNGPFWRQADLPDHYRNIRDQALQGADHAMMEILINLRSAVREVAQPQTVIEGIQAALDAVGIQISAGYESSEPLPAGFKKAADLAHDLAQLANEIEDTSAHAVKAANPITMGGSSESIRSTLENMRQVREAEQELDQELRG